METDAQTSPSAMLRLLLDEDRLRILGLLGCRPYTERALAAELAIKPGALTRHMRQLRQAGLVTHVPDADETLYTLDVAAIQQAKRTLFAPPPHALPADDDAKTLAVFVHGGRIRHMPTHAAKLRVVLAWLADQFEADRVYTEAEVNQVLIRHHEDFALWRRYLVDEGLLTRAQGIYQRVRES